MLGSNSSQPNPTIEAVNQFYHPQSILPPSLISVLSSSTSDGELDFLRKRQVVWEESSGPIYYMLRKDICSLFYASLRKLEEQPEWLKGGKLRDYQLEGLNFLVNSWRNDTNVILADEMGLGKIVQSVSMLGFHQNAQQIHGPFLGVVPLSSLSNWAKEFRKWLPEMNIIIYVGTRASREGYGAESAEEKQRLLKLMRNFNFNGESGSEPYTPTAINFNFIPEFISKKLFIIGTLLRNSGSDGLL
ncbi:probable ATP-dependent DNA helicase CHR23 isoform X2 [Vigna radiata var. radiata]|uniref:Probable ATP-dependent DNA helicase CHR23 isoform X2 n=1 Tax=Vigna radiata var. radiata TaxID=3916 RepID=A0A3Q0EKG9_VIGRR|nr:probable ATP-dependent DNA helicase CHR23 isoform X2 [Vigna radiata var. radiata]